MAERATPHSHTVLLRRKLKTRAFFGLGLIRFRVDSGRPQPSQTPDRPQTPYLLPVTRSNRIEAQMQQAPRIASMKPASQCDPGSHPASVTNLRLRLTAFAGALTRDGVVRVSGLSVCGCFESSNPKAVSSTTPKTMAWVSELRSPTRRKRLRAS